MMQTLFKSSVLEKKKQLLDNFKLTTEHIQKQFLFIQ